VADGGRWLPPRHGTGTAFIEMLRERMPEKQVHSNVGSRFTFGA
jgi:hypothetical protein